MVGWFFRKKKGGKLLTPEPAERGPALSRMMGGDVHVDVGPPNSQRRAQRLARAEARIARLKLKRQKAIALMNAGRIDADRCDEVCRDIDFSLRRYEFQRDMAKGTS